MGLRGRKALVTGAAVRIGRAIALELGALGCDVMLHYGRSRAEAAETAADLAVMGVKARLAKADLAKPAQALALARAAKAWGCDILVNNASIFPRAELQDVKPADWDRAWAVNLRAPALLTQALGAHWKKRGTRANIVNVADVPASLDQPGYIPYSISKAGLLQLTRSSAVALAPKVLVCSVSPGPMIMPPGHTAAQKASSLRRSLLKRLGGPQEVARAVAFALESGYLTGSDIKVDGGRELARA